ncbi:MAG TPA: hypothetical protein VFL55_17600 [Acetobacteraceae bacterium]|nr:hypothetical protein [Acetobacteraceae bacterium]
MRFASTALALTFGLISYAAIAQTMPPDRVYMLHSRPTGQCPALDWHIGVDDQTHMLSGVITWGDHMQNLARAEGPFDPVNHTFKMEAKEVGGQNRTAQISGQVRQDGWLVANITGPVSCSNVTIPWFRPNTGTNQ